MSAESFSKPDSPEYRPFLGSRLAYRGIGRSPGTSDSTCTRKRLFTLATQPLPQQTPMKSIVNREFPLADALSSLCKATMT